MKPTGRFNLAGDEIMQIEEHDIDWSINWEDMTINQKANFCSLRKIGFLGKDNEEYVQTLYLFQQARNNEND